MTPIEKLAREAQLVQSDNADRAWTTEMCDGVLPATLERFAQAVAKRCAEIAELESGDGPENGCCPTYWEQAQEASARTIRREFGIEGEG